MQPQFIVTIQPAGTKFDPPARLSLPNVDGHLPGAQVEMYSFDHDLEEFVAIGLGTVSKDGTVIRSNEGVGVIKAGWHCGSQPDGGGCGHSCEKCKKCAENCSGCVTDEAQANDVLPWDYQVQGDCKDKTCSGFKENSSDIYSWDEPCNTCKEGALTPIAPGTSKDNLGCCYKGEKLLRGVPNYDYLIEKCPARAQNPIRDHEIDGCSGLGTPQTLYEVNSFWGYSGPDFEMGINVRWGSPVSGEEANNEQSLACNKHDVCYQSCGEEKQECDQKMYRDVRESCDTAYRGPCPKETDVECNLWLEEYDRCKVDMPALFKKGLNTAGFAKRAYEGRQVEYCSCCELD